MAPFEQADELISWKKFRFPSVTLFFDVAWLTNYLFVGKFDEENDTIYVSSVMI